MVPTDKVVGTVAGTAASVAGQSGLDRRVGQHGVDLPGGAVGVVHPCLVLHGVAAGRRFLDLGGQALARQTPGRLLYCTGGLNFDA